MKKIFLLFFLIFLFLPIVNSTNWEKYGGNIRGSFIQNNGVMVIDLSNITSSSKNNITSTFSPLIADLNGDGVNEIITIINSANEIRLYRNGDFDLIDTYYNPNITVTGQMAVTNFISGSDENELVFITNIEGNNVSLYALNWNGTDFNISKNINISSSAELGYGLNCINLDTDNNIECAFFSSKGQLYIYDETNNYKTVSLYDGSLTGDCVDYSIPKFYDYDDDEDYDILSIWDSTCNNILQLTNNNDGSFTFDYNYTIDDFGSGGAVDVNDIMMANLDGGQKELVITKSYYYYNVGTSSPTLRSSLNIFNILDNTLKCSTDINDGSNKHIPYLNGLNTCYQDEGGLNCDYDNDGYNEIYITRNSYAGDMNLTIFDYDCSQIANIKFEDFYNGFGGSNNDDTAGFPKGVWGNFDSDNDFEYLYLGGVWEKNGTRILNFKNYTGTSANWVSSYNYFLLGDVTTDGLNDIVYQDITNTDYYLKVVSLNRSNSLPSIDLVNWNTGNPICNNTEVTYEVDFTDEENNYARISLDCFGNGTIKNGTSYYLGTAVNTCLYNKLGDYETIIYLQDTIHPSDLSVNYSHSVDITNSEFCNDEGEQPSNSEDTLVGTIGGVDDWSSKVPDMLNDFGFKSTASKIFFGICLIIALIMLANEKYKSAFVSVVLGILGMVGLTYLGIFPIWLTFLIFLFAVMVVFGALLFSGKQEG